MSWRIRYARFGGRGYEVRVSYSAEEAVETLAHWEPNLAILDVVLPVMNGIDLAILLKAQYPDCRILLFSGQAVTTDLLETAAKKGHSFEVIAKPAHPTILLERVLGEFTAQPTQTDSPELGASGKNKPPAS